jgi:hypothetical protein
MVNLFPVKTWLKSPIIVGENPGYPLVICYIAIENGDL